MMIIQVLEGLMQVLNVQDVYRDRTDGTGLHHSVCEIVDNAVDEASSSDYWDRIDVISPIKTQSKLFKTIIEYV